MKEPAPKFCYVFCPSGKVSRSACEICQIGSHFKLDINPISGDAAPKGRSESLLLKMLRNLEFLQSRAEPFKRGAFGGIGNLREKKKLVRLLRTFTRKFCQPKNRYITQQTFGRVHLTTVARAAEKREFNLAKLILFSLNKSVLVCVWVCISKLAAALKGLFCSRLRKLRSQPVFSALSPFGLR